jgi:hypothetical protein
LSFPLSIRRDAAALHFGKKCGGLVMRQSATSDGGANGDASGGDANPNDGDAIPSDGGASAGASDDPSAPVRA